MEILIVGAILVAAMVFISTKIKKSAASAFKREVIEGENFRIVKPEGFINPINENSEFAFEAYSKEFGKNDADEMRQARANVVVRFGSDLEATLENAPTTAGKISSKKFVDGIDWGQKICLMESESIEANVPVKTFYKYIENEWQHKIYQLQISVLAAYSDEYKDRTDEMLESFVLI